MSVLDVKDFSFTYPNSHCVIHSLSFSLEAGEMLLICGKNGCGKSTLLRSIKQEVAPKGQIAGSIRVNGTCQILFQDCDKNIIFRTAYEDLIFPACNYGLPEEEIERKADEVLALFGISHLKHRNTATLSGGEKQMLSLAALLILEPDLLLLDEPLSQLDEEAKQTFLQKLMLIKNRGTAIIIAEHSTDTLLQHSEKVLIFEHDSNTVFTKESLHTALSFPNFPAYIYLQKKLGLPLHTFTPAEAVKSLAQIKEDIVISPLALPACGEKAYIRCEHVRFAYEDAPVLEDVSFSLRQGEIAFLCGKNGAGKSTLLSLICGFLKPDSGEIQIEGGHKLGYLAQDPTFSFLKDTLGEDYRYVLKKNKLPPETIDTNFETNEIFTDLKAHLAQNPLDLSGGERAKAAMLKLLLIERDIMILDEPEKHLDTDSMAELSAIIRALASEGCSFIIVSHSPDFIYNTASTVSLIENGTLKKYQRDDYFPQILKTSLYQAIEPSGIAVSDVKEAEVKADG
ncbi:MAG: ABC-F family ATP-binding cassette domain-containing protein [Clostridia bacterium]|nr:ABC-F family ATP-binding cassette domain-containing protein [Clostridia bacterium]